MEIIINWIAENQLITLLLSIIATWFFSFLYFRAGQKSIAYFTETIEIISEDFLQVRQLQLLTKSDSPSSTSTATNLANCHIPALYKSRIKIKNRNSIHSIDSSDVPKSMPIMIKCKEGKIIYCKPTQNSNPLYDVKIEETEDFLERVIKFDYIPPQGFIEIEVLHTSNSFDTSVHLKSGMQRSKKFETDFSMSMPSYYLDVAIILGFISLLFLSSITKNDVVNIILAYFFIMGFPLLLVIKINTIIKYWKNKIKK